MEIMSIFTFNPKLRHYTGLKKEHTVSFKENSLKRDTLVLNQKNEERKIKQNLISKQKKKKKSKEYYLKKNELDKEPKENQDTIESSLYWDLKYNNLL